MGKRRKTLGITLVALVITVVILIILAGVAMSLITGEEGLFAKANHAATLYKEASQSEASKFNDLDAYLAQYVGESSGMTFGEKYDELEQSGESLIGKIIDYRSVYNDDEIQDAGGWIILGKQTNVPGKNGIIITTTNPVSSQSVDYTLAEWVGYEEKINNACKTYVGQTGTLGEGGKAATIRDVRSITLEDINNAVGFTETINSITISESNGGYAYPNEEGTGWIINTDDEYDSYPFSTEAYWYFYDNGTCRFGSNTNGYIGASITLRKPGNMDFVLANDTSYWVASRSIVLNPEGEALFCVAGVKRTGVTSYIEFLCYSGTGGGGDVDEGDSNSLAVRPVVILSSEIPWEDVENLIYDAAEYE